MMHRMANGPLMTAANGEAQGYGAADPLAAAVAIMGHAGVHERNAEIVVEGSSADRLYRVVAGVVRVVALLEDGRRQIVAFHFPGDVFGLEPEAVHDFTVEAVTPVRVMAVPRAVMRAAATRDAALAEAMFAAARQEIRRLSRHLVLLGRRSAAERVLAFLADTAARQGDAAALDLSMSRQDIADHLGLTIETVSRTMTHLQETGMIALDGARHIRLTIASGAGAARPAPRLGIH